MHIRISALIVILLLLCGSLAYGQYRPGMQRTELHFGLGAANVFGDLGGTQSKSNWMGLKDIQFSQTRPLFYGGGRMFFNDWFSAKLNIFAGMASGSDENSKNESRGYTYTAWMLELSGQVEWNFWRYDKGLGNLLSRRRGRIGAGIYTHAYVFAGVGVVYSRPTLDTHGMSTCLGEYTKTSTAGLAIPVGLGIQTDLSSTWAIGFEIGRRFTTTDYLDALSSEWSKKNDTYYFTTLHAIYKMSGMRLPKPGSRKTRR